MGRYKQGRLVKLSIYEVSWTEANQAEMGHGGFVRAVAGGLLEAEGQGLL